MKLNIGIIGASIAGLACAIELQRLGSTVTVFEKFGKEVRQNGAGMMLPMKLVQALFERNLISNRFQGILVKEFSTFIIGQNKEQISLTDTPIEGLCVHWKNLCDALLDNFDQSCCHYNSNVTHIKNKENQIEVIVKGLDNFVFDYVICADGYNSLGRKTLFPDIYPEFANYIAWRGVVELDDTTLTQYFGQSYSNEYFRYLYENGHLLIYPVPNSNAASAGSRHVINWVLYENLTLFHPLFKNDRALAQQNFVPGTLPSAHLNYLNRLNDYYMPSFPANLIRQTKYPFVQAIFDVYVPRYTVDRLCLLGDSSILLRPHVGSNATKALEDAMALRDCIAQEMGKPAPEINSAFRQWNDKQHQKAKQLFPLSRELGELLVTHVPDLTTLTKERMDMLWEQTVSKYEWYGNKAAQSKLK